MNKNHIVHTIKSKRMLLNSTWVVIEVFGGKKKRKRNQTQNQKQLETTIKFRRSNWADGIQ